MVCTHPCLNEGVKVDGDSIGENVTARAIVFRMLGVLGFVGHDRIIVEREPEDCHSNKLTSTL